MRAGAPLVVAGDFNVALTDEDVWDYRGVPRRTHVSEPERTAFEKLLDLGLTDALPPLCGAPTNASTPFGTIRRAPSSATEACASITCSFRPILEKARDRVSSIVRRAPRTSEATMLRWSSTSPTDPKPI